ncbi:hypothetical protein V5O48_013107 [Marasmius crinis-equi]|uniref:Uncharacterized protein n=1 Tax=Marasmius crinis-equi TaxID=585013 RepID=A0ABR3F0Y7_9AGAR
MAVRCHGKHRQSSSPSSPPPQKISSSKSKESTSSVAMITLDFDITLLQDFIVRSGCQSSLNHPALTFAWDADKLLGLLDILPSLTSLAIFCHNTNRDAGLTRALKPRKFLRSLASNTQICPVLESLELVGCSQKHAKDSLFSLARAPVGTLKSFHVRFVREHQSRLKWVEAEDVQSALTSLRSHGVEVDWVVQG